MTDSTKQIEQFTATDYTSEWKVTGEKIYSEDVDLGQATWNYIDLFKTEKGTYYVRISENRMLGGTGLAKMITKSQAEELMNLEGREAHEYAVLA